MQQIIPQPLCSMHGWTGSTRCSHRGIQFGDVIERDQREEAAAREISQRFLNHLVSESAPSSSKPLLAVSDRNNPHLT